MGRQMRYFLALEIEGAPIGLIGAGDDVDQCRFSGPIFAEQNVHLSASKLKVDVIQRENTGKLLRNFVKVYE